MRKGYDGNAVQTPARKMNGTERESPICSTSYSDNVELIRRAKEDGGESEDAMKATSELIEKNQGLVKKIAMRFCGRGVELEDLIQIGTIGMIKAIRSFDTDRGTCFSTYAVPLIFGEIRRHIRDEGPIKVGRYYKRLGAMIVNYKNKIMSEEGREAHISELASLCGVSVEDAAMAADAMSPIASLSDSAFGDEDGMQLGEIITDEEGLTEGERIIDKIAIAQAIATMPAQWQKIVALRYYRNMTQQEVAATLGLTQVKVSREEKKIIEHLRKEMT